jgi:hypothetical protein
MQRKDNRQSIDNAWLKLSRLPTSDHSAVPDQLYPVYNISRGGLRFSSTVQFDIQERLNVRVHLPNNTEHTALGRICYCEKDEQNKVGMFYGISFLDNFLDMTPFQ